VFSAFPSGWITSTLDHTQPEDRVVKHKLFSCHMQWYFSQLMTTDIAAKFVVSRHAGIVGLR